MECYERLIKCYKVGVPLVTLETADPGAAIDQIKTAIEAMLTAPGGDGLVKPKIIAWNCVAGVSALNSGGAEAVGKLGNDAKSLHPVQFLGSLLKVPEGTVVIMHNAHRFLHDIAVVQAIWNLRDSFKANAQMLIMLGAGFRLPVELQNDVIQLVEPLPSQVRLSSVVRELTEGSEIDLTEKQLEEAANAAIGVTEFAAENLTALAISREAGLDIEKLWASKRKKIDETPALKVITGGSFDRLGGLAQAKKFMAGILNGNDAPRAIVFIDEIEKALGGAAGDTSGVSQDQLGKILGHMQDTEATGVLAVGPPGGGKSAFAKAAGSAGRIPTIQLDLGGAKGSLVGQSEQMIRDALKVLDAVSGRKTLWIATCLEGDTIVQLAGGKVVPIRSVASGATTLSANIETGEIVQSTIAAKACRTAKTIRIGHSFGELLCTADHPVFRACESGIEEIHVGEVSVDDYIASPLLLPHGSGVINHDLAYLVGYTCGDGGWSAKRIYWTEADETLANYVADICQGLFGVRASVHKRSTSNAFSVYLSHEYMGNFGERFASSLCGTHNISVPVEIAEGDEKTVASFLSGAFDAEGSVSGHIAFTSTSKLLRDQILMLLRRFGIYATCGWYVPDAPRVPSYRLTMSGDSAVRFANLIGFRHHEKQRKAMELQPRAVSGKRGRSVESVPVFWSSLVADGFIPRHDKTGANRLRTVERKRLTDILESMKNDGLECLVAQQWLGFAWSRVKTKVNAGESLVYDVEVPKWHNFIAGGLVVHNCNSLTTLPPELRRRFKLGTWFFDLPTAEERESIWALYAERYEFSAESYSGLLSREWTGAEIEACCDVSWRLQCSVQEAAAYIVPVAVSAKEQIDVLRKGATGRFLSASRPGLYDQDNSGGSVGRRRRLG